MMHAAVDRGGSSLVVWTRDCNSSGEVTSRRKGDGGMEDGGQWRF